MKSKALLCSAVGVFALSAVLSTQAAVLNDGLYQLVNHRAGGQQPPAYGLRLDGLDGNNHRIYSFDFEGQGSDMRMDLDVANGTIRIFGTAYGGRDVGSNYENPNRGRVGLWQIDFTYRSGVQVDGQGRIVINPQSAQNNGYIQPLFDSHRPAFQNNPQIPLVDYNSDPNGNSFLLGLNHRGNPGVSGWGWLNHSGNPHVAASDWLFEVLPTPIPSPTGATLGLIGLCIAAARRRS